MKEKRGTAKSITAGFIQYVGKGKMKLAVTL